MQKLQMQLIHNKSNTIKNRVNDKIQLEIAACAADVPIEVLTVIFQKMYAISRLADYKVPPPSTVDFTDITTQIERGLAQRKTQ